jgi:hypothetical protein
MSARGVISLAVLSCFCLAGIPGAIAAEVSGVTMADTATVASKPVVLNGIGMRCKHLVIACIDVYVGGLYLEKKSSDANQILNSTENKRVRMQFVRDVGADKIREAFVEGFEKSCTKNCEEHRKSLDQFLGRIPDIKDKGTMDFDFTKDSIEFTINDKKIGVVKGAEFARLMLMTWLGDHPPTDELKSAMLGKKD